MVNDPELNPIIRMMQPTWDGYIDQVFIKDRQRRYVYVNRNYLEVTGLKEEEVIGRTGDEIFSEVIDHNSKKYNDIDFQVLSSGRTFSYEAQFELRGKLYYSKTTKSPLINAAGEIVGIFGLSRDMSSEIETREELKENYKLMEILMDTVPYPMFVKDDESRYLKVNQAFLDANNTDKDNVIGKNDIEFFGEELGRFLLGKDNLVKETGERQFYITSLPGKDHMTIKDPYRDKDGKIIGVIGIVNPYVDISDLQRHIIGHQRAESLSALAGGIAHDLRNILTVIMGLTETVLINSPDEETNHLMNSIEKATQKATDLVNRMVKFAKHTEDDWVKLDFRTQVEDILMLVNGNLPESVRVDPEFTDENLTVKGDRTHFSQMILNLLLNAIEATDNKEGENMEEVVRVKVSRIPASDLRSGDYILEPSSSIETDYVLLEVSDTGCGIDSSELGKIFDPFFTTKSGGTGLGLPVIYGVVTTYNGYLKVQSVPNEGTTFQVYLPLEEN